MKIHPSRAKPIFGFLTNGWKPTQEENRALWGVAMDVLQDCYLPGQSNQAWEKAAFWRLRHEIMPKNPAGHEQRIRIAQQLAKDRLGR
jgi:hypothetical protein